FCPWLVFLWFGTYCISFWKTFEISGIYFEILPLVVLSNIFIPDKIDDIIFLPRSENRLRGHRTKSPGKRLVDGVGVFANFETVFPKFEGCGNGTGLTGIAMAVEADRAIYLFAPMHGAIFF